MLFIHCLITYSHIFVSFPTQELLCHSAFIHLGVKKWDRKWVLHQAFPFHPLLQRMGIFDKIKNKGWLEKAQLFFKNWETDHRIYHLLFIDSISTTKINKLSNIPRHTGLNQGYKGVRNGNYILRKWTLLYPRISPKCNSFIVW